MRLLLDTHTFLWFINGDVKLSGVARAAIEDLSNERFVSIATIWEMTIKNSLGKLSFAEPIETFVPKQLQSNVISVLPITQEHTFLTGRLPFHHRDPFDRMLIAQSIVEDMTLISADSAFDAYTGLIKLW